MLKLSFKLLSFILTISLFFIVFGCGRGRSNKPAITKFKNSEKAAREKTYLKKFFI